jgi:hypothetical protein
VDEAYVLGQKVEIPFANLSDSFPINSTTPMVTGTWYDFTNGRRNLQAFMNGLDVTAAPVTVALGGGCANGGCSYLALGSSSHVRLVLNSATGNATTGVPNLVTAGTVTLTVPEAGMLGQWWNTATGAIISSFTTAATAGSQTFTAPNFSVDMWLQLDRPASGPLKQLSSEAAGVAALAPGSRVSAYGTDLATAERSDASLANLLPRDNGDGGRFHRRVHGGSFDLRFLRSGELSDSFNCGNRNGHDDGDVR